MSNTPRVILPEAFRQRLSAEALKELEEKGVQLDPFERLKDFALKPPQVGETVVGTMTTEEVEMYCRWKDADTAYRDHTRQLEARQHRANADKLDSMTANDGPVEPPNITTMDDLAKLFRFSETALSWRDLLAMAVRQRLDLWHFQVVFRSEGRVCRGPRRTAQGCDE